MGRQRQLTSKEKKRIIRKVKIDGVAVVDVAKQYGRNPRTIYRVVDGTTCVENVQRRPPIDEAVREAILEMTRENNEIRSHEIRARLAKPIADSTINRIIRESPFYCKGRQRPVRRPMKKTK